MVLVGEERNRLWNDPLYSEALSLQRECGVLDLHVDSIIMQRLIRYRVEKRHQAGFRGQPFFWHADIPRMRDAGYSGACMGLHYPPVEIESGWWELQKQIDYLDRLARRTPACRRVWNPEDWESARERGEFALAPGVEGAHMLGGKIDRVEELASRGVAYLTLVHFCRNVFATPSMGVGAGERDGLTSLGRELVCRLNGLGIGIDVAHLNRPGVLEVCQKTRAPVFCTHTGVRAVHNHARNISDEEIDAIASTGGAIGIMFCPNFLAGKNLVGSDVVVRHIDHVVQRVGLEHVVVGTDYDGWIRIPVDQKDCRDSVRVTYGLMNRGYSVEDLRPMFGSNARRIFHKIRSS